MKYREVRHFDVAQYSTRPHLPFGTPCRSKVNQGYIVMHEQHVYSNTVIAICYMNLRWMKLHLHVIASSRIAYQ